MNQDELFSFSATAQLVVDPYRDVLISCNQEACRLWRRDTAQLEAIAPSQLFYRCFEQLMVFTQELISHGRGWTDRLLIELNEEPVRVEVTGRYSESGSHCWLHMSIQCFHDIDMKRQRSDADAHYSSGLQHWNQVRRVFQEFERENRLLLEAAGEGIYGVNVDGITTFVNPAAERILGYTVEELAGRNMHNTVHHSHADGSHFHACDCPIFSAFRDGSIKTVDEDVFWHKSGRAVYVEYTSTPVEDNGLVVGAVVVFRDISQKKASEQQLRAALEEVEDLKYRLELENAYLQEEINSSFNHHHIIGRSPALGKILQQIDMVAPTDATVLIIGESGTGKELIARAIHDSSERSGRSLIRVNCAAIPEELFESEFFGHAKGAFTGAISDRLGRFELADGGTLFLDEVGEIPLHLQSKLLRVLQEQQFERVGETTTRCVDVRIIAATNQNLKALVDRHLFREDLYFRLNVFPIESVPLRDRQEDIPLLAQHFLQKAAQRAGKPQLKISLGELETLMAYDWPGNIRELENVVERQVILASGDSLRFSELRVVPKKRPDSVSPMEQTVFTESQRLAMDKVNISTALAQCQGKVFGKEGAAALLELKPTTLVSRIKKYKIDTSDCVNSSDQTEAIK